VPSCSVSNSLSICLLYQLQLVAVSFPRNPHLYLSHSPHSSDGPKQRVSKEPIQRSCWVENIQNWRIEGGGGGEVLQGEVLESWNEILERWIKGGCKRLCAVWREGRGQFGTVQAAVDCTCVYSSRTEWVRLNDYAERYDNVLWREVMGFCNCTMGFCNCKMGFCNCTMDSVIAQWDSVIAQWDSVIAKWDSVIAQWDSVLAQWNSVIAQWDSVIAQWNSVIAQWNSVIAQWNSVIAQWNSVIAQYVYKSTKPTFSKLIF
jgi:hypothetical protein